MTDMNTIIKSLLVCFSIFNVSSSYAQIKLSGFEYGLKAGTFIYQGDLVRSRFGSFKLISPMVAISVGKLLNPSLTARVNFASGRLTADEAIYQNPVWKQQRNFAFSTPVKELSADLIWNIRGKNAGYFGSRVSPYLFAGAGISFLNIRRDWSRMNSEIFGPESDVVKGLEIDAVNPLPKLIPVFPAGAGIRYYLSPQISLIAEGAYRFLTTDYLDGFKYAANNKRKDSYYGLSAGIVYTIYHDKYKCPTALR